MASGKTYDEQCAEVAYVASLLFGTEVKPEHVIGETLQRATPEENPNDPAYLGALRKRLANEEFVPPEEYEVFIQDILASWIETTFGIAKETGTGRLVRATPISITGLALAPDGSLWVGTPIGAYHYAPAE